MLTLSQTEPRGGAAGRGIGPITGDLSILLTGLKRTVPPKQLGAPQLNGPPPSFCLAKGAG